MKFRLFLAWVSMVGIMLTGCAYDYDEPQPTPSVTSVDRVSGASAQEIIDLLMGRKPEPPYGIRASRLMPTTGPCSYAAAVKSNTDIQYIVSVLGFASIGRNDGMMHVEKGVMASWPHDVYLRLKAATPEARGTSAMIIEVTRESFASLVPQNGALRSYVPQIGIDALAPYYVTTYECLSPSRK